jgi:D-alanyl-D-alanine carboxypeptidase/D-alanyl-D-alanine-endopeptidase (penicillin-binding protein 4)
VILVDANVAVKWFLPEPGAEAALALIAGEALFAPALIRIEVLSGITRCVRLGTATKEESLLRCQKWYEYLQEEVVNVVPDTALFDEAVALSMSIKHALKDQENEPLETWIKAEGDGHIRVTGKIPANKAKLVRNYEVPDPALFARALLIEALQRSGVQFASEPSLKEATASLPAKDQYEKLPKVAELVSPPFAENARLILKVSHNLHASTLPLLVALKHGKRTLAEGLKLERDFLARSGVDVDTISFGGGAGGARSDYVTPAATVQLLRHMATRPDFFVYERALPILGVDGTLAKTVSSISPAKGKVQAKTGTLTWENLLFGRGLCTSKALAGYLTTARGRRFAFAAFINGVHMKDGIDTKRLGSDLGKLCEIVHGER